jgi:hypothetical protein
MLFDGNGRTYRALGSAGGGRAAAAGKSKTETHKSLFDARRLDEVWVYCRIFLRRNFRENSAIQLGVGYVQPLHKGS